jgi:hypothetical protein
MPKVVKTRNKHPLLSLSHRAEPKGKIGYGGLSFIG